MRKQVFGRQLKRDTNERKALFKGLASSLVIHERIETTEEKAKAIKGYVEKMVTKAKNNDATQAHRLLQAHLTNDALKKLLSDVAPRFADRQGGYTRIIKLGNRFSDNASMALIEWVVRPTATLKAAAGTVKHGENDEAAAEAPVVTKETKTKKAAAKPAAKKTVKKAPAKKAAAKKEETK